MASGASIGHTTSLAYGTSSSATSGTSITAVGEVKSFTGPSPTVTDVDVTNLESANYHKEFIPGLIDSGDLVATVSYGKAQTTSVYALLRTSKWWIVTLPDTSTWLVEGYVKGFGQEQIESEKEITNTITIKVVSKPVFTAAS
jgi:hypothetical protein